jgi:hypothetical protein
MCFLAGQRWFNVGIQIKTTQVKSESILKAELTFNCHRGNAIILNQSE